MTTNDVSDTRISTDRLRELLNGGTALALTVPEFLSIVSELLASRHPQPVNEPGEWEVERTVTGETVNGIPVLGWLTYKDIPGIGVTPRVVFHWSTPGKDEEVIRLIDAEALRAASIPKVEPRASTVFQAIRGYLGAVVSHADVMAAIESALEPSPATSEGEAVATAALSAKPTGEE